MELEPTSERMVVDHYRANPSTYLIYLFHEISYRFALPYAEGRVVLDLGCGSGYGSERLAAVASHVVGADVSADAVEHARKHHARENLAFAVLGGAVLPFDDAQFDCVVCFQVIEHVADDAAFVSEIRRVLRPNGVAVLATPDRTTRLFKWQKPWNRWHVREYSAQSFHTVLGRDFSDVRILHMGGRADLIAIETRRCARLKWLTIPVTLPFVPERVRKGALAAYHWMRGKLAPRSAGPSSDFGMSVDDLRIEPTVPRSVNLVAVVRKQDADPR